MDSPPHVATAAEKRLVEDAFNAFQYVRGRDRGNTAKRRLALGAASILLRDGFKHPPSVIACILQASTETVLDCVGYVEQLILSSADIAEIITRLKPQPLTATTTLKVVKAAIVHREKKVPKEPAADAYDSSQMHDLVTAVAQYLQSSVEAMRSDTREISVSCARTVAMAVAHAEHPAWDRGSIGRYFDRDRSDVTFSARRVSTAISRASRTPLYDSVMFFCEAHGLKPECLLVKT